MSKEFYLTTPLYYVNDKPHIGHSYTEIIADVLARVGRLKGERVFFLTGTDEYGQKIAQAAAEQKTEIHAFVDANAERFKSLWSHLNISFSDFIRTTEPRHQKVVQEVWRRLHERGDIYKGHYEGLYCTPCETFWPAAQVPDRLCPDCRRGLESVREENYFFAMSKYQSWLLEYLDAHPGWVVPASRQNEMASFLRGQPLNDLCVSRPKSRLTWGIPVPFDAEHVTYVWFDALINYISAAGWPAPGFECRWPADLHLIGKDILRPHVIYWPIMLYALGLQLPRRILAHGWWTVAGDKMSKSKGNVIDPYEASARHGVDAYRYFLLREVPTGSDGDFSWEALSTRYHKDLADDLGNLVLRALHMIQRYLGGRIPAAAPQPAFARDWTGAAQKALDDLDMRRVLEVIWEKIRLANQAVEENKPWAMAKDPARKKELADFLYQLAEQIRRLALALWPFIPVSAAAILQQVGARADAFENRWVEMEKWGVLQEGAVITVGAPLFPKDKSVESARPG